LAVDLVSGDRGVPSLLEGVLHARRTCLIPFTAHLCGRRQDIIDAFEARGSGHEEHDNLFIEDCPDSIEPGDTPSRAWKTRTHSPVIRCITLQKEGRVDASVSAGDTGILMGAAIFLLGRMEHVSRPALAAFLPTTSVRPVLLLDVGANIGCRAEQIVTFGRMGFNYFGRYFGDDCPKVALLNVGHEESKGSAVLSEAGQKLGRSCRGYCGFIEGGRVLSGDAQIVVCDGFVGNVLLKACESFHALTAQVLSGHKRLFNSLKKRMTILNAENYGAVPFLGVRGVVYKAHGSSSAMAFSHALAAAVTAVHHGLPITHDL
jgi:glycerol-3-phosphate acyltransferase PlsX